LQCHGLPYRKPVRVICILSNLDLEAWITCNRAEVVKRSHRRIESQFIGVHVAGNTTDSANECLEIVLVLEVVIPRNHSAGTVEKTDVEYGPTERDMERVTHEWASGEVEASGVCDLAKDRFDFRLSFSTFE
jgi:hypothetical protein